MYEYCNYINIIKKSSRQICCNLKFLHICIRLHASCICMYGHACVLL